MERKKRSDKRKCGQKAKRTPNKKGHRREKTPKTGEATQQNMRQGSRENDKKRKAKKESKQTFKTKGETDRRQNKPHAWQLRRIEVYLHPEKGALMVEW